MWSVALDSVQPPRPRNALELAPTPVRERDTRTGDQRRYGTGYQDLPGPGDGCDPGADVDAARAAAWLTMETDLRHLLPR
jgi:hypothetical protein